MITQGQKLKDGDCIYGLTEQQAKELLEITIDDWNIDENLLEGLVFNGLCLFPVYIDYCSELEEYSFPDFKTLCENTFGNG